MKYTTRIPIVVFATAVAAATTAPYTWPSPNIDEIEDTMFLLSGYNRKGFADAVSPCSFSFNEGPGKINAAEWLRTSYHDMATADVAAGTGGLDASISFETDRDENKGAAFNRTFGFLLSRYSPHTSMADLIALGTYAAVRSCGGPSIPVRVGRVDASASGPLGVPQPQENQKLLVSRFAKAGFNTTDMIALTACGHTLGGVHGEDFPTIVGDNQTFSHFDKTYDAFDNKVVTEYLNDNTTNPLINGHDRNARSDLKVFTADNNQTMKALASPAVFKSRCQNVLQRMIDTVPRNVKLSAPLVPLEMKPTDLRLVIDKTGALQFTGDLRLRTTGSKDTNQVVTLTYADRSGKKAGTIIAKQQQWQDGIGVGFDEQFTFFGIQASIPSSTGISSFNVTVTSDQNKKGITYTNNNLGFSISDLVLHQDAQTCLIFPTDAEKDPWTLNVVAAIHDSRAKIPATVDLSVPVAQTNSMVPSFAKKSVTMTAYQKVPNSSYTLYRATYIVQPENQIRTSYDVTSGNIKVMYRSSASASSQCVPL